MLLPVAPHVVHFRNISSFTIEATRRQSLPADTRLEPVAGDGASLEPTDGRDMRTPLIIALAALVPAGAVARAAVSAASAPPTPGPAQAVKGTAATPADLAVPPPPARCPLDGTSGSCCTLPAASPLAPGLRLPAASETVPPAPGVDRATASSPPRASAPPAVAGAPVEGATLAASSGAWSDEPTSLAYRWQWSDDGGSTWMDVRGARGTTFLVSPTFVEARVRVVVTAANAAGSAEAASAPVAPVAAAPAAEQPGEAVPPPPPAAAVSATPHTADGASGAPPFSLAPAGEGRDAGDVGCPALTVAASRAPVAATGASAIRSDAPEPAAAPEPEPAAAPVAMATAVGGAPAAVSPAVAAPVARTTYDADPFGPTLDRLWLPHGCHCVSADRVQIVADPLGGARKVERNEVRAGDVMWGQTTTNRSETMSQAIALTEGERGQIAFGVLLPAGFASSASAWNSLADLHYPNDGPAQSPFTLSVVAGKELWLRVLGGPLTPDRSMGSIRTEAHLADLTPGVWHGIVIDLELDAVDGVCDVYVDGRRVFSRRIPTVTSGVPNAVYWKQGFYRSAADGAAFGTQQYYFSDTAFFREPDAAAALAFVTVR